MADEIEFLCPACDRKIEAPVRAAGRTMECPNRRCRESLIIPSEYEDSVAPRFRSAGAWITSGGVVIGALIVLVTVLATGSKKKPTPAAGESVAKAPSPSPPDDKTALSAPVSVSPPAAAVPFEAAFHDGQIAWQAVRNIQLTTKTAGGSKTETFDFVTRVKYDAAGRASPDTTGQKTYSWPDRDATFGPGAVIRITRSATVREGTLRSGDEWTWTGQQWQAVAQSQPGTGPANSPIGEWARQEAKRLESRRLVTVNLQRRLIALTNAPGAGDTVKDWQAALKQLTGQQVEFLALTILLPQFSSLWKGEEFLPAESQRYVARLKQLPKDVVGPWRDGLKNVTVDRMEDVNAALVLIQMNSLFEGERYRAARAAQLLPRVRSLSRELLQPWADALEGNTLEAAVELIDQDWLFENDRLKVSALDEALRALRAARSAPPMPAPASPKAEVTVADFAGDWKGPRPVVSLTLNAKGEGILTLEFPKGGNVVETVYTGVKELKKQSGEYFILSGAQKWRLTLNEDRSQLVASEDSLKLKSTLHREESGTAPFPEPKTPAPGVAGKDSHESLVLEMLELLDSATVVFATIKDRKTAMTAAKRLADLSGKLRDLSTRSERLGMGTPTQQAAIEAKYKDRSERIGKRFADELIRVAGVDGGADAIEEFTKALTEAAPIKDPPAKGGNVNALKGTWKAKSKTAEIELTIEADGKTIYLLGVPNGAGQVDGVVGGGFISVEKGKFYFDLNRERVELVLSKDGKSIQVTGPRTKVKLVKE